MPYCDLSVKSLNIGSTNFIPGEERLVFFSIINTGEFSSGKFNLELYLSSSQGDHEILLSKMTIENIDINKQYDSFLGITIPNKVTLGEHYLELVITEYQPDENTILKLREITRNNNERATRINLIEAPKCDLTLEGLKIKNADISGEMPKVPYNSNNEVEIICKNIGDAISPSSSISLFVSDTNTPVLSDLEANISVPSLKPNESITINRSISIGNINGTHKLIAYVDKSVGWNGNINEINEKNNTTELKFYVEGMFSSIEKPVLTKNNLSILKSGNNLTSNNNTDKQLNIFPNPNNGKFTIEGISEFTFLQLYNLNGKIVYASILENIEKKYICLENLPQGIYILKLYNKENTVERKIIIK